MKEKILYEKFIVKKLCENFGFRKKRHIFALSMRRK